MFYYTYVIKSKKDGRWYTGCTDDLRKRFKQHNNNEVSSTKSRGPFNLIYYEVCLDKYDAFRREKYLKSGMGKRYLKNRLKRFLSLTGQVRVYNRALSPSEITQLYQSGASRMKVNSPPSAPFGNSGLVGYWSFNGQDMNGNTVYDRSGSSPANNGTTLGSPYNGSINGAGLANPILRPQGAAYDIGAYEYLGTAPDTIPPNAPTGVTVS